ncbi:MAG: hypothetical protein KGD65_16575, partial [Candidatus Lokiarchaeota archaeon]|nr:hypothetical protein [Candidatus Lokiarchaeota archaeon]
MKISKRNRPLVLISLILFPMVIMLCSFSLNAQAGPFIPEPDPNNGWYWDVDVGDKIYFEGEFIITNATTGDLISMWKDIWIYNITTIENVTIDWLGIQEFSQVNATQCYFNVTEGELEAYDNPAELALFGYNNNTGQHKIRAGMSGMPFLLPKNGSSLEVDILAPIINETFYYPMGQMAYNNFTNFNWDIGTNRIHFWHAIDPYYSDGYYYNNGTLDKGEAYLLVNMGEDGPIYVNATMRQVPDYIITDEVTWGVNVGDEIPFTMYMGSSDVDDADEIILNITSFTDVLFNKSKNSFSDEDNTYMVYQAVFADMFMWNGTDYNFMQNTIISAANNFYPQYYDEVGGDPIMPLLWPINVPLEDYEFMWNLDTLPLWEGMRYDTINIIENGLLEFELSNSTGIDYVEIQINKTTGITQSFLNVNSEEIMYFEVRSQTLVDWPVDIGNVIYYKNNGDYHDGFQDIRATISGSATVYVNMSALVLMYNSMGIPMTLPTGQPEFQFFSYLVATFEIWNSATQTWDYDGESIISIANTYWPISPLQFEFGAPLLMPENTATSDLTDLFDMWGAVYDDITYSPGYVVLRNSTLDRSLNFHFDETSGRVTMMYGWFTDPIPGSEWNYMSIYPKFYQALNPGSNSFTMSTDFPTGVIVDVDVDVGGTGTGAAYIYNQFSMNPVNVSVPNGTASTYFDMLFANHSLISGNITLTIHIPTSIDLTRVLFFFYAFNMSGTEEWDAAPPEFYLDSVTYNFVQNTITITMPPWDRGVISAMAFIDLDAEPPVEIPGYNIFFLS